MGRTERTMTGNMRDIVFPERAVFLHLWLRQPCRARKQKIVDKKGLHFSLNESIFIH